MTEMPENFLLLFPIPEEGVGALMRNLRDHDSMLA